MNHPKRTLQVVTIMNCGSMESRLMDIYRAIDKYKVQFEVLTRRQKRGLFDDEIESLGGIIYRLPPVSIGTLLFGRYVRELKRFYLQHFEYETAYVHLTELSAFPLIQTKRFRTIQEIPIVSLLEHHA